ncbi:MAG: AsmA family protein [Campylobacterales bacterium]|nr:AsmA family protein [Campylobacterales bacterium]
MRKIFIGLMAFFAIVVGGLVIAVMVVDLNQYKHTLEASIKDASGYDVRIEGDIKLSLRPVGVSVRDVQVSEGGNAATVKEFAIALEVLPLLSKEIKVHYLVLKGVEVKIQKDANKPSTQASKSPKNPKESTQMPLVEVARVNVENMNILYMDVQAKTQATVENVNLAITDIRYDGTKEGIRALGLHAKGEIEKVRYEKYTLHDIEVVANLRDALVDISQMDYRIFDSKAKGSATVDLGAATPKVSLKEHVPQLKLANFSKEILGNDLLEGVLDMQMDLDFIAGTQKQVRQSLEGAVVFEGKSVGIKGYDVDKILSGYEGTQNVGLMDVGSFLVAGPLGFMLSSSAKGAKAYEGMKGGATAINHLHVKIPLGKGIATLEDVAMSTGKNLVATKGKIDMVNERFLGVSFGILEKNGCAKYEQEIEGALSKPSIKVTQTTLNTVVNMASSLFGKATDVARLPKNEGACQPFYKGKVEYPL